MLGPFFGSLPISPVYFLKSGSHNANESPVTTRKMDIWGLQGVHVCMLLVMIFVGVQCFIFTFYVLHVVCSGDFLSLTILGLSVFG